MSGSLLLWVVLAIAIFWIMGLYKRVSSLRMQAMDAWAVVERTLRQYASVVDTHLGVSGTSKLSGDGSLEGDLSRDWAQLLIALAALDNALKDARHAPLAVAVASRLGATVEAVHSAWAHLGDAPLDLAGPAVPEAMRAQWDAVTAGLQRVRSGFNDILTQYNEAIDQFPARMVTGVMRFETAGLL